MFYKKIADRKFYCKMWTNGKLVRKYSCIEADSISDILVANKCSYSDDEHPKLPQDKEEYDEYINRRPNIASWNNKLFYPYHQIWNTRLHLEREKLLVQALWSEIRRIDRKEEALHHEKQEILYQLIPAGYAMVSKFYKIGDIIEDLYGNKFLIESIDKMTFTCRRLDNGKPSKFSVHVLYSQFEPKLW